MKIEKVEAESAMEIAHNITKEWDDYCYSYVTDRYEKILIVDPVNVDEVNIEGYVQGRREAEKSEKKTRWRG
jgi:hypothetical protein